MQKGLGVYMGGPEFDHGHMLMRLCPRSFYVYKLIGLPFHIETHWNTVIFKFVLGQNIG